MSEKLTAQDSGIEHVDWNDHTMPRRRHDQARVVVYAEVAFEPHQRRASILRRRRIGRPRTLEREAPVPPGRGGHTIRDPQPGAGKLTVGANEESHGRDSTELPPGTAVTPATPTVPPFGMLFLWWPVRGGKATFWERRPGPL